MEKILVVEDDRALAMGIEYALQNEGLEVVPADSIVKAKECFALGGIDLILLDVTLPDGNGFEFCKEVRKSSSIPIIFLTARDEEVNVVLGLDIGGDDYITKPFRVKELVSRIKACLRRKAMDFNEVIHSGEFKLDIKKQKLYKNDLELVLTPVEYKLAQELINNPRQVLSRSQILGKVFDIDGNFLDDNTLSVYMRRIREKIEEDPSKPEYVITVRGTGYMWNKERS